MPVLAPSGFSHIVLGKLSETHSHEMYYRDDDDDDGFFLGLLEAVSDVS